MENVLASRYASQQMVEIWSAESRIILERELWVAVLKAQKELGIEIEDQVIEDYESVISSIDPRLNLPPSIDNPLALMKEH